MKKHEVQQLSAKLPVTFMQQDGCVIAYTPALDLSTYGSTQEEATKNFHELLMTFFSELKDTRELDSVLLSLGWVKNKQTVWQPPKITQTQIDIPQEAFA